MFKPRFVRLLLPAIAWFVVSSTASATVSVGLSTIYFTYESSVLSRDSGIDPAVREERTIFPLDASVGLVNTNKIYLGLTYHQGFYEEKAGAGSLASTESTRVAYGPAIGYMADGMRLVFSYFISAENTFKYSSTSNKTIYSDGSGYQFDIGYGFKVGANAFVGPNLIYRTFSYDTLKVASTSNAATISESETLPTVAFWLNI